jgi:hypothetical protein
VGKVKYVVPRNITETRVTMSTYVMARDSLLIHCLRVGRLQILCDQAHVSIYSTRNFGNSQKMIQVNGGGGIPPLWNTDATASSDDADLEASVASVQRSLCPASVTI